MRLISRGALLSANLNVYRRVKRRKNLEHVSLTANIRDMYIRYTINVILKTRSVDISIFDRNDSSKDCKAQIAILKILSTLLKLII